MKKYCVLAAAMAAGMAASAFAAPNVNSAKINERIFNDYPGSSFVAVNNYPANITLTDSGLAAPQGFANRHNWRLSADGGASNAQFANGDTYAVFADVTISTIGTGAAEGGLQISPWWSPNVDGVFNLRTTDGEVAIFGGRLPFYSFTGSQGVTYTPGTTVRLGVEYDPQGLSAMSPGLVRYSYGALTSGWLAFDEGNPAEEIPHGVWGALNNATVGGFVQVFGTTGSGQVSADFSNIEYIPAPGSIALLAVGGAFAARRRR